MAAMLSERVLNSKNGVQYKYILECIADSSRANELGIEFETHLDIISFFFEWFKNEYNYPHNKKRFPNLQDRIADCLRGLPSYISIDFYPHAIIENGKNWGLCNTDKKENEFVENWFSFIALRLIQIANKVGYNIASL